METRELRLGNLIYDNFNRVCKVESIGLFENVRISGDGFSCESKQLKDCMPIPLTKDWLLKFGFVITKEGGCVWALSMPDYDATLQLWHDNEYMSICRSVIAAYHFDCKYVHQLQNLYFALTGEELTIKL